MKSRGSKQEIGGVHDITRVEVVVIKNLRVPGIPIFKSRTESRQHNLSVGRRGAMKWGKEKGRIDQKKCNVKATAIEIVIMCVYMYAYINIIYIYI